MVEAARPFLQSVEGRAIARLLAALLILVSTVVTAEHDHHDDEEPVHAGGACILCNGGASGDGDLDLVVSGGWAVFAALADNPLVAESPRIESLLRMASVRVRGPPIAS
ncbi:MAG: hypothetical protein AAFR65_06125 [Pseudomonadota bacterium]